MEMVENVTNEMMRKLGQTFQYVFIGILLATLGAGIAFGSAAAITGLVFWMIVIAEFAVLFAFIFTKKPVWFYLFTTITGVTLVPVLAHYVNVGASHIILQALAMTTMITGGLTYYAMNTKKNFLGWGTILFWILVGLVVLGFINLLIGSTVLALIMSAVGAVLFSFYIIHDTQQVLYTDIEPMDAAMGMYLNILNLFLNILSLLGIDLPTD
jgi:modulator of FtsH protease